MVLQNLPSHAVDDSEFPATIPSLPGAGGAGRGGGFLRKRAKLETGDGKLGPKRDARPADNAALVQGAGRIRTHLTVWGANLFGPTGQQFVLAGPAGRSAASRQYRHRAADGQLALAGLGQDAVAGIGGVWPE